MRFTTWMVVTACLGFAACGRTPSSPSPSPVTVTSPGSTTTVVLTPAFLLASAPAGASTPCPAIGFDDAGGAAASVTTYTKCAFTVTATTPNWVVWTGYGAPAPFIGFMSGAGVTTTGEVRVTAGAGTFTFESADIYSSTTPIPYVITGLANAGTVFTLQGTQPNTFGNFATVRSPNPGAPIDTLLIRLSNPAAACCPNPVGLDNIVVR
jgi:hypothetical protein